LIGWELVEVEQHGAERAGYGEGLMKRVATRLSAKFGKGFSLASLKRLKQFYLAFPRGSALVGEGARLRRSIRTSLRARSYGQHVQRHVDRGRAAGWRVHDVRIVCGT